MKPDAVAGWTVALLVLAGILTAWIDSGAEHYLHAAALLCGAAWMLHAAIRRTEAAFHWLAIVPVACAGWAAMQVLSGWTVSTHETWNSASAWLARAAVFCLAFAGFRDRERRESCITAMVWFGGAYALLGLLGWYAGNGSILWLFPSGYTEQVAGTFANRDQFAALMELLLPFALARTLAGHGSAAAATCAGLMFASVVASASRAGVLIVAAEALVFIAVACRRRNYQAAGFAAVAVAVCTLIGGWTYALERFSLADPFAYRREMLAATVEMIRSRPLTGFGLGSWPAVYPGFAVFDPPGVYMNHAHNDWAEWAADGGIAFVLLPGILAGASALFMRRRIWAMGVPAVFLHAAVDFPLHKTALFFALVFVTALVASTIREHKH